MRVGMGYDVHKLTEGRKLILGGVDIPWEKGLRGHSDADVLIHCLEPLHLETSANIFRIHIRLIREFPVLNCWFMWRNCLENRDMQ